MKTQRCLRLILVLLLWMVGCKKEPPPTPRKPTPKAEKTSFPRIQPESDDLPEGAPPRR